jgi:hypothetical protein
VPGFHLCDVLVIGFDARGGTAERLRTTLKTWTHEPRKVDDGGASRPTESRPAGHRGWVPPLRAGRGMAFPPQDPDSRDALPLPGEPDGPAPQDDILGLPEPGEPPPRSDVVDLPLFAGTFVVIRGVAYYAFVAAWLNVFILVGYLRGIQIALALLAMFVGAVHIKDFFAFTPQPLDPESAKPGL